jgi:hypothetical protein
MVTVTVFNLPWRGDVDHPPNVSHPKAINTGKMMMNFFTGF